jgi:hypothetical protein
MVGAGRTMTVKGTVLVRPVGVVTLMLLAPAAAVGVICKVALTCISLTTRRVPGTMLRPPPPAMLITVDPVSPLPKRLTGILCPRTAWAGEIESSTGPVTVKGTVPVVPPGVVTKISRAPTAAAPVMVTVAVMQGKGTPAPHAAVVVPKVPAVMLTPFDGVATFADVPVVVKPVPARTTGTDVARRPEFGVIETRVGVPGETTLNTKVLVFPVGLARRTFRAVSAAPAEIVNVAVTVSGSLGHPVPV